MDEKPIVTWDTLIRDYNLLITSLKKANVDVKKFDKITEGLRSITTRIDGKYIQKSTNKDKRDKEFQHLEKINKHLLKKLDVSKSTGKPSPTIIAHLGLEGLADLSPPPPVNTPAPDQLTRPPFFKGKYGPFAKIAILGGATFGVLYVISLLRKKYQQPVPTKHDEHVKLIKERIIERIPMTKERITETTRPESESNNEVVQEVVEIPKTTTTTVVEKPVESNVVQ